MQEAVPQPPAALDDDDARLRSLGYRPQLGRVLGLFGNFSVAFTFMAPVIGIFSFFTLGLSTAGPAYLWLSLIPVAGMFLVALVLGELASHYPAAGALYQYAKYTVGRRFGWFVGWFYGIALLVTVAAVDAGAVNYVAAFAHDVFGWTFIPTAALGHPGRLAGPADHPDHAEHHRRQGHLGLVGLLGVWRGHPGHDRHRDRAGRARLPPRARLPDQHAGRPARQEQPARRGLRRQLDRRRAGRGARLGLHLPRLRVARRLRRGDPQPRPPGPAGHAARPCSAAAWPRSC